MAEATANYTQFYKPLEVGKNTIDWASLQNPWSSGESRTRVQALATSFKKYFVDPLVGGNRNFTDTFTKEQIQDVAYLKKYIKTSSILSLSQLQATGIADSWEDFDNASDEEVYAILGAYGRGNTDPNSTQKNYVSKFNTTSSTNTYLSSLDTLVTTLEKKGLGQNNITDIINHFSFKDSTEVDALVTDLNGENGPEDGDATSFATWLTNQKNNTQFSGIYEALGSEDSLSKGDIGDKGDTGDTEGGGSSVNFLNPSQSAVLNADDAAQTASTATQSAILGDSTLEALRDYVSQNEGYTLVEDAENNTYTVTDADGNTVDTFAVDEKNNQIVYVGGEKDGQRFSPGGLPDRIDTYQDVEDTTFASQQALADEVTGLRGEYEDYTTSVLGGDVTEGVAQQLGWTKTATGWTDPQGNKYTVNKNTGILESGGVGATTKGTFEDADFAGQINAQLNQFLTGKDADGKDILDEDGNPIKGFLDYQSDLEGAAATYKTDMKDLAGYRDPKTGEWVDGLYDTTYKNYADDLEPLRGKLSGITDAALQVAGDANNTNYYNRLSDLYYQDAKDEIDRNTAGVQDTLTQQYASAGLDPSSPAFTAAMADLAKSRSDSLRSSRRQAILDSYGLGSKMLSNRTSALNSASSAIGTEMGALDSLYGVKLEGLNTRRDMIGQIYGADKDVAATGISGLNTVLNTNLKGIDADQTQFNTKLNLNNDFYGNLFKNIGLEYDVKGGLRDYADKETTDAFDTLVDYDQSFKSDDFTMGSFQLALQQAYPDGDIPEPLQNLIDKYSSK